jgi:predicted HicB family RNase H-like nuclease
MSCQGKLHVQPGHAPITRTMSQTSVNEDADLASDVAISPSKTKKRASRPAPEPEPPKRRAKRQRYAGEDMAILTVRIPERERALCYADATETIRTINAHVIHRLKHLVAKKGGVVRGQDVHSFIEAHGQGLGQRFVIRLPVSLQEEVKALAERSDASVNALIRYALFQYPAPPSDMHASVSSSGVSWTVSSPTQRESNEGSEAQHIQWHAH